MIGGASSLTGDWVRFGSQNLFPEFCAALAGFEGGTKINVNTISPFALRDRVVAALIALRASGRIADLAIGEECSHRLGVLSYTGA